MRERNQEVKRRSFRPTGERKKNAKKHASETKH